ncbi:GTP cyclohydrolase I [Cerasibacillus quisquiliarum]|uniref:GTP cyclohydrolase FolE2 n=1 Tax=Cerasibacillus quisquiliarum TaxID=227865 RepID=A0A511UVE6_9BACI|nr:GTP cyclohydrolase FolE2 [Cerasibacillus quisquiliarum]MBB5145964.1 GTP cyclohydrolase I [Cerasibacillus quisquiliarum]GEN30534.1 GTP cyclohydrolase FolE2 [Cerasibacillus quisquiliarum]
MEKHVDLIEKKQLPHKEERLKLFGSVKPGPKTKPVDKCQMTDIQNMKKDFLFELDAVGIDRVKHPITVTSQLSPQEQTTVAQFTFTSSIKQTSKGTNMSRFMEQLQAYHERGFVANFNSLKHFAKELSERLNQRDATISVKFPWFYERRGPASRLAGLNHADITMTVNYDQKEGYTLSAGMTVQVTTLCPCSKEISEYSAHNQRGNVTMEISFIDDNIDDYMNWKEELLEAAESNASARLHPVLKRPDEKMVTEQAYENPRFVEDMVRLVAADLYELDYIRKFKVSCRNEESIHMHDAIASLTYDKLKEKNA